MLPFLLSLSAAHALDLTQVSNPCTHGGWVSDTSGVIDAPTEERLDATLDRLHRDTDVEVAVVTVDHVAGTPKSFATALFNRWGVGDAQTDNGVLVLLVREERRIEIETGIGMRTRLSDAWLQHMEQDRMVPAFKGGDFSGGFASGIAAIDAHLRAPAVPASPSVSTSPAVVLQGTPPRTVHAAPPRPAPDGPDPVVLFAGLVITVVAGAVAVVAFRVHRQTHCEACGGSGVVSTRETLVYATLEHGGRDRITRQCPACGHVVHLALDTPSLHDSTAVPGWDPNYTSRSSNDASSNGGSFGGGSSDGGGAGSSY